MLLGSSWDNWEKPCVLSKFRGLGPILPDIWKLKNVLGGGLGISAKRGVMVDMNCRVENWWAAVRECLIIVLLHSLTSHRTFCLCLNLGGARGFLCWTSKRVNAPPLRKTRSERGGTESCSSMRYQNSKGIRVLGNILLRRFAGNLIQ